MGLAGALLDGASAGVELNVEPQDYLRLVERARSIAFLDIEATGLKGDYNSVLVVSIRPFGRNAISFSVRQPGNDQRIVRLAKDTLETFDCWVTYYGKGFDIPMLNTRLLRWGHDPIDKRPHIDMYYTLKANVLTARRSQAHLLEWLQTPETKMTVSADVWNRILENPAKEMPTMIRRCESDTAGLQALYNKTRHLIRDIKK